MGLSASHAWCRVWQQAVRLHIPSFFFPPCSGRVELGPESPASAPACTLVPLSACLRACPPTGPLLQRQLAELVGLKRGQLEEAAAAVAAEEAALAARQQAVELGHLKQQLAAVQQGQVGGPGCGPAGGSAGRLGKENGGGAGTGAGDLGAASSGGSGGGGQQVGPSAAAAGPRELAGGDELSRLLRERQALLDSGAYRREDALVREMDRRIRQVSLIAESH